MLLEYRTDLDHSKIFELSQKVQMLLGYTDENKLYILTIGHWLVVYINVSIQENQFVCSLCMCLTDVLRIDNATCVP